MTALILLGLLAQSAPPLVPADGLNPEDPEPPPGATGAYTRRSNGTICFVVADEQGALSQLCRSAFGDYPLPLATSPVVAPVPKPRKGGSRPPPPPAPLDEDLRDDVQPSVAGSQFGVVGLAAGAVSLPISSPGIPQLGGMAAIGLRYGLKERHSSQRMLMPGIALVIGAAFQPDSVSPFAELRAELMSVSPGGTLQPNFVAYGTLGAGSTPLQGGPFSIQPHLGFGLGWNWLPGAGGGGSGGWGGGWGSLGGGGGYGALLLVAVAVAVVAIVGFVVAGRLEVRYTARPLTGPGSDYVSVMLGYGF